MARVLKHFAEDAPEGWTVMNHAWFWARVLRQATNRGIVKPSTYTQELIDQYAPERRGRPPHNPPNSYERAFPKEQRYCRTNPSLRTGAALAALTGTSHNTVTKWRASKGTMEDRQRQGFLWPTDVHSGLRYYQLHEANEPTTFAYAHCRSWLYQFHCWAWGRQAWATYLIERGEPICPYDGLTPDQLLDLDRPTFIGFAEGIAETYLPGWRLALGYIYSRRHSGFASARMVGTSRCVLNPSNQGQHTLLQPLPISTRVRAGTRDIMIALQNEMRAVQHDISSLLVEELLRECRDFSERAGRASPPFPPDLLLDPT
jgi:hypothetical protein